MRWGANSGSVSGFGLGSVSGLDSGLSNSGSDSGPTSGSDSGLVQVLGLVPKGVVGVTVNCFAALLVQRFPDSMVQVEILSCYTPLNVLPTSSRIFFTNEHCSVPPLPSYRTVVPASQDFRSKFYVKLARGPSRWPNNQVLRVLEG